LYSRRPDDARGRPRDYLKKDDQYASIFGKDKYDLNVYLKCVQIARVVDEFLDTLSLDTVHRRNLPYYLCMYATCAHAGNPYTPPKAILKIDVSSALTTDFLKDCHNRVFKHYEKQTERHKFDGERDYDAIAKGHGQYLLKALHSELKRRFKKA
jgi:hypothetical protein